MSSFSRRLRILPPGFELHVRSTAFASQPRVEQVYRRSQAHHGLFELLDPARADRLRLSASSSRATCPVASTVRCRI